MNNNYINNINNNFIIKTITPFIKKENIPAYIVGGFVRDCLLEKDSCDVDIAVKQGYSKLFAQNLADYLSGYFVELDEVNKIYRVVFSDKQNYVDIADICGSNIEEDLKRRDFTINSLAYDLKNAKLIDVTDGIRDLEQKIVREISAENITDDPVRILRAFRFQSQLGFEMTKTLEDLIKKNYLLLNKTAKERINAELIKLFGGRHAPETLRSLYKTKILEMLIPEVTEIAKIPPNSHHHLNLFEHSVETVNQVQLFYDMSKEEVKQHLDEIFLGGQKRLCYLKFAAFLHDVGKPVTWKIEPDTGRHRFIMHDSEGARLIVNTLKNLKFSKKQIAYIQKIIKYHIYPASVVTAKEAGEKAYMRFYRKMEDETIDTIAVAYADRMSALGPEVTQEMLKQNIDGLLSLLEGYLKEKNKLAPLPKLLDGKEIMEILDIPASPELGNIIEQLKEAQLNGDVNTKDEAVEFIKGIC